MRLKVDEDLPRAAVELVRSRSYDARTVREQAMGGFKDAPLWAAIQQEERFLITGDKGFGDVRSHPPGTHAGVLVLRPNEDGIEPIVNLLRNVLDTTDLRSLAGAVAVANPRGLRVRRG